MTAVASSVFQRKDGMWAARYIHNGKRKHTYSLTEDEAVQKRKMVIDEINASGTLSDMADANFCGIKKTNMESRGPVANISIKAVTDTRASISANKQNSIVNGTNEIDDIVANVTTADSFTEQPCMTLGEWLIKWLDRYVRPKSISTYTNYAAFVNKHIIPAIGDIRLPDLSAGILQGFFERKAADGRLDGKPGGMSPQSLANLRFMLKAALDNAIENGLLSENPVAKVKIQKPPKKVTETLSLDERTKLIELCRKSNNLSAFGIVIALRTGLQLGELLALKWSDVDFSEGKLFVRSSLGRYCKSPENTEAKSTLLFLDSKAERIIDMRYLPDEFVSELESYRSKQKELLGEMPETVIASANRKPIDPSSYNKLFKRMLNASGISCANFEILRCTFTERCFENKFSPAEIQRLLGCGKASKSLRKFR